VILDPHPVSNQHQNLIISSVSFPAHDYYVWSTSVNAFVSYLAQIMTDKMTNRITDRQHRLHNVRLGGGNDSALHSPSSMFSDTKLKNLFNFLLKDAVERVSFTLVGNRFQLHKVRQQRTPCRWSSILFMVRQDRGIWTIAVRGNPPWKYPPQITP